MRRAHVWLKLLLCLALLDVWVRWSFVPGWLTRRQAPLLPSLIDMTGGTRLPVLFAVLPHRESPRDLIVYFVGDSSVGGAYPPQDFPPWMLRAALESQFPDRRIVMVNCTTAGLHASDALVVIAKALATHPDLVIYAMSPRIVPTAPDPPWVTAAGDLVFDWDVVSRVGLGETLEQVGVAGVGRAFAQSAWMSLRLRHELLHAALETGKRRLPAAFGPVAAALEAPVTPPPAPWRNIDYLWPRADYRVDADGRSMHALAALIDLCAREGHCLLYHVPTNPSAPHGFEPGLIDEFAAWVSARTAAAGVPYADYRSASRPEHFRINLLGLPDGLHPNKQGYEAFVPLLTSRVAAALRAAAP